MLIEMINWDDEYLKVAPSLEREPLVEKLDGLIKSGDSWFIWKEGDDYIAWVLVFWSKAKVNEGIPDMVMLHVRPDWRRKGIASKMISECEIIAMSRGYKWLGLNVTPENEPAINLYTGLGYSFADKDPYELWGHIVRDMNKCLEF